MFNSTNHRYSEFKNQELYWLGADSKIEYQKNIANNEFKLREYNWIDNQFTYKFNSHGFRSEEFNNEDSVMFLGCSLTVGIGLPVENTWVYQVAQNLNLKCFNLGNGGTGPDTAFRLANHYIPQVKPKLVVYLEPPPGRFVLLDENKEIHYFFMANLNHVKPMFKQFYQHWLSNEDNLTLDLLKHQYAIQALCQHHNIKFVYSSCKEMSFDDLGRDLMHPGVESNKDFAELILNRINQNN